MSMAKRMLALALCGVLAIGTLLMGGCSTPDVALTVDGVEYKMGDYLAYLYNAYSNVYYDQYLYYYEQLGTDVMAEEFEYEGETYKFEPYLKQIAVDTIIRQEAIKDLMQEYKISVDEEDEKEFDENYKELTDTSALDPMTGKSALDMGFRADRYIKALKTYTLNETALFYGLYDKGGKYEIADKDIRTYFDDNYVSYKIIEITMQDDKKADLDEAGQKKIKDQLNGYLAQYKKHGDFDKVIEQYKKDTTPSTTAGTGSSTAASTTATTTGTTAAETTTDGSTTGTTTGTTTSGNADKENADKEDEKEETDPNRVNTTIPNLNDEDFAKALKKVAIGSAEVITYKKGGTTPTAALVLRLDPEKGTGAFTFTDERQAVIYGIAFEQFNDKLKEQLKKLDVETNKRAIRMATIKDFRA